MWDKLSAEAKRWYIDAKLSPRRLLHIFCSFTRPRPKEKFLALVCVNPELRFFVVNSDINEFIKKRPHLEKCQVRIDKANHTFLNHDSFIDCTTWHHIPISEIRRQVSSDFSRIKTLMSDSVTAEVIAAVKFSRTLSPEEKAAILAALEA